MSPIFTNLPVAGGNLVLPEQSSGNSELEVTVSGMSITKSRKSKWPRGIAPCLKLFCR